MFLVNVSFYRSKSRKFERAKEILLSFPNCRVENNYFEGSIEEIYDFCRLQSSVYELISIVQNWTNAKVFLNGEISKTHDYTKFIDTLRKRYKNYSLLIRSNFSNISLGDITIEDLPFPIVYYPNLYGAFFAFSEHIDSDIYFCKCEQKAIENYILLRHKMPLKNYEGNKTNPLGSDFFPPHVSELSVGVTEPLSKFQFKDCLCFRCNKKTPSLSYCHPMYGGTFRQHYGWYVQQEYFRLGIDKYQIRDLNVIEEYCSPEIYDNLRRLKKLVMENENNSPRDYYDVENTIKDKIDKTIENSIRTQLGFKKIGESWVSETILASIISGIFPHEEIIRHYRPSWLEGLELDVFLPNKNIAFEYQGIQHFKAVKHWGGDEKLKIQKEHDERKKRLCKEIGVDLICINYNDPLTTGFIKNKLHYGNTI